MKKSRTLKMFSARAAMLMFAAMFSAGAWAQSQGTFSLIGTFPGPYKAVVDGTSGSEVNIPQGANTKLYEIEFNRVFQVDVPATIVLPFPTTTEMTITGGNFYQFACVDYDETKGQWVASMTSVDANNLQRNTPYIVVPTASKLTFDLNGTQPWAYTGDATVICDCWAFVGTYQQLYWVDASVNVATSGIANDESDPFPTVAGEGDYYGFAANGGTAIGGGTVSAGEFVKCSGDGTTANSAYILPMRAYLQYIGADANNDTKKLTRQSGNNLPTSIAVVLRDANGEVTNVGAVSKETGEITFEGWFTTDGIKLPAEPTKSGVYIHNGKKVVVK